jgi:hypothetical protein
MKPIHPPPPDQAIVDDYFQLSRLKGFSSAAWLYGMIATYGVHPKELKSFEWSQDNTIKIITKKNKIKPLHPQWSFLFQLKEKQPSNIEDCFDKIKSKLNKAIETQKVSLNFTDLQLAYQLRKGLYCPKKEDPQMQSLFSLVLSAR